MSSNSQKVVVVYRKTDQSEFHTPGTHPFTFNTFDVRVIDVDQFDSARVGKDQGEIHSVRDNLLAREKQFLMLDETADCGWLPYDEESMYAHFVAMRSKPLVKDASDVEASDVEASDVEASDEEDFVEASDEEDFDEGFDVEASDEEDSDEDLQHERVFVNGFDCEGYNSEGYDVKGFDRDGFDHLGFDERGLDGYGYDKDGLDSRGFNQYGYNKEGYNRFGYNKYGFDKEGYDKSGFDDEGFNKSGFDAEGFGKDGLNVDGVHKSTFTAAKEAEIRVLEDIARHSMVMNCYGDIFTYSQRQEHSEQVEVEKRRLSDHSLRLWMEIESIGLEQSGAYGTQYGRSFTHKEYVCALHREYYRCEDAILDLEQSAATYVVI